MALALSTFWNVYMSLSLEYPYGIVLHTAVSAGGNRPPYVVKLQGSVFFFWKGSAIGRGIW